MDYESLSTIIVLVILVIIAVGWLPRRTVNSMKRVVEHREDRYSSSLHLVDAHSGTRFSDERTPQSKGAIMQPVQSNTAKLSPSKVAHIRELRRAAARRRRIIVMLLLAMTLMVLIVSFPMHFSPLFSLIPAALLLLVLGLGVRASRHAREWERALSEARRSHKQARPRPARSGAAVKPAVVSRPGNDADPSSATQTAVDDEPTDERTDVMEGREIRQALRRAEIEQSRALAARQARREERAREEAAVRAQAEQAAQDAARVAAQVVSESVPQASVSVPSQAGADGIDTGSAAVRESAQSSRDTNERNTAVNTAAVTVESNNPTGVNSSMSASDVPIHADMEHAEVVVMDGSTHGTNDMTTELSQVHPATALDAFEVAASQDLISFSLGAPRNGVEYRSPEPESLEIRSTKQVAKAEPPVVNKVAVPAKTDAHSEGDDNEDSKVTQDAALQSDGRAEHPSDAVEARESQETAQDDHVAIRDMAAFGDTVNDTAAFHETELASSVDAPVATSDSLGNGLEAILARRSA